MNRDTDLFVQAFWVKCRETIRPELDFTVDDLKSEGHAAHVATQEYSDVPDGLPEALADAGGLLLIPGLPLLALAWLANRASGGNAGALE